VKALLVIASCLYVLAVGEGFVRVFAPAAIMPRFVEPTAYGLRGNVPSTSYWHYTSEVSVEYRINAAGIRADREIPLAKPASTCRVVLFGDSFFMGYEVDLKDAFATLLEKDLQAAGYRCQVVNLAVSGYGTAEMLVELEQVGFQYSPDVVIFQWHRTDPEDNVRSDLFRVAKDGQLVRHAQTYLPSMKLRAMLDHVPLYRWLEQNSQLFCALRERGAVITKRQIMVARKEEAQSALAQHAEAPKPAGPKPLPYRLRLTRDLLAEGNRVAHEHGAQFMVFEVPTALSRTQFDTVDDRLTASLPTDVAYLTPIEAFRKHANPDLKLYYEHGAGHWTPLGNQIAAHEAAQALIAKGWLDRWR